VVDFIKQRHEHGMLPAQFHAKFNLPAAPVGVGTDIDHMAIQGPFLKGEVDGAVHSGAHGPIHSSIQVQYKMNYPMQLAI
jgi:hypothetical protein